jgi:hypothetical protein
VISRLDLERVKPLYALAALSGGFYKLEVNVFQKCNVIFSPRLSVGLRVFP